MTRCTGRGAVVPACLPASIIRVPVPRLAFGMVDGAMLGFIVDLYRGVIRTEMALVAGLGPSRLRDGELVPGMAATAAADAVVRILSPYADVGPRACYRFSLIDLHDGAVAGVTAARALHGIVQAVVEPAIDLPHDLISMGVFAPSVLGGLLGVATAAGFGCYHHRDGMRVNLQMGSAKQVAFLARLVTLMAVYAHLSMAACLPIMIDSRRPCAMTGDTGGT